MYNPEEEFDSELAPELGGVWRDNPERSGFEPELGGVVRQKGVYVDEVTCIGCKNCTHVASNTFYIEGDYGRARVFNQNGDTEGIIQEAIDTCPVNCIHWLDYTDLKQKESERKYQSVRLLGFPQSHKSPKSSPQEKHRNKSIRIENGESI